MEFFFHAGSPGWKSDRHDLLYERLALRFGTWRDGRAGQVFVERLSRGVSIKRIAQLSELERGVLVREATRIYEAVMFG